VVREQSQWLHLRDTITRMRMGVSLLGMLGKMDLSERKQGGQTVSHVGSMVISILMV